MQTSFAWSLSLSAFVVLFSIGPLTFARVKAGYSLENMAAPRAFFDQLPDFGKRAVWSHHNCWESFTLHASACLLCLTTGVISSSAIISAFIHPLLRLIYIGAYVGNIPLLRGLCWASGVLCSGILYKAGLDVLLNS